jgi:hypothetical protein
LKWKPSAREYAHQAARNADKAFWRAIAERWEKLSVEAETRRAKAAASEALEFAAGNATPPELACEELETISPTQR